MITLTPELLGDNGIFVFGSNTAGRHGKGAALYAVQHFGAIYGQGYGLQGRAFAVPTKDAHLKTLFSRQIQNWLRKAYFDMASHEDKVFWFTMIGCGLAGHSPHSIQQAIQLARIHTLPNVKLPSELGGTLP
jgi:hypothetical protein